MKINETIDHGQCKLFVGCHFSVITGPLYMAVKEFGMTWALSKESLALKGALSFTFSSASKQTHEYLKHIPFWLSHFTLY